MICSIDVEGELSKRNTEQLLVTLGDAQKYDKDLYYGESPAGDVGDVPVEGERAVQKSGYLRVKM